MSSTTLQSTTSRPATSSNLGAHSRTITLLFLCSLCLTAHAQTVYIDTNGATAGFGWANGVTATWNATNSIWTTSAAGTNATTDWSTIGGGSSSLVTLNGTVSTSTVIVVGNYTIAGLTKNAGPGSTAEITINTGNSLTFAPGATVTAINQLTFRNLSPLGDFTLTGGGALRFYQSYTGNITNNSTVLEIAQTNNIFATGMNVNMIGSSQLSFANPGYVAGIGSLSGNSTTAVVNANGNFTVNQNEDKTFSGIIVGQRVQGASGITAGTESNFTKNGSATLELTGNNTYGGATIINAGTLSIATIGNAGIKLTANYTSSNAVVTTNSTTGLQLGMTVVSTPARTRQTISSIGNATTFTMNGNANAGGTDATLAGFANGLGLSTNNATNLQIGNATLRYTGVTASTDRNFTLINGTTAGLDVSNATTTLTMSGSAAATTGGLNKLGNGTLAFSGNHSYSGATTISAGTLSVSTLADGLAVSSIGQSSNIAGNLILNGGALQYTGAGVNTNRLFSLQSSSTIDASGTGALNFTNTGSMGFNSGNAAKTLTLTGNNTGSNTLAAVIGDNTGATSLSKAGTGTWVLTGANTYSGGTTISTGTLALSGATGSAGSGGVSISSGAALQLANSASTSIANNQSGAGNIVHTSGAGVTTTLSGNNTNTGAIVSTGGGTLLFSGANALSTGLTSLNATSASTLSFADGTTRTITLGNSTISLSSAALSFDVNLSTSASDQLNFGGAASLAGTNTVNLSFLNSLSGAQTWTLLTAASGLDGGTWSLGTYTNQPGYTFSLTSNATTLSLIASAGSSDVYWTGSGGASWTATNFSSTINGPASIAGGNLTSSSKVYFAGTGAGNLTTTLGADYTINSLTVSTPEVTINGSNSINVTSSSSSGIDISATGNTTIGANLAGNAGLSKSGTGTLTLNGSNTYSGGTSITGGTVVIGTSTALGNAAGVVTLNPGTGNATTLQIGAANLTLANNLVLTSGTTAIDTNSLNTTASGILSGTGTLTKLGTGTLALSGNNSHSGPITITTGALEIASTGRLGGGTYLSAITNNGTFTYSGANDQTLGGVISGTGALIQNATSTLTLSGNNTYTGTTTINAGVLNIRDANALGSTANGTTVASGAALQLQGTVSVGAEALTLSGNGVSNDGALRNISQTNSYAGAITLNAATRINSDSGVLILSGNIGGAGQSLTLGGAGTVTLTGSNTYTGTTTISGGNLQIGNAGTTGNLSASSSITNNGILTFNRTNNITQSADFGSVISGTGALIQAGSGNLILSGANTYSGNTTLNSGTLCINNSGTGGTSSAIGTGTLIINGGTLNNTSGSLITLSTNNTQIWNSGFTFTGTNDLNLGTGNVTLSTGLSVTVSSGNLTVGGVISGTVLNKYGAGTLILSGNNTYSGTVSIYSGTLSVSTLANGGVASGIGQSSNAAGNLILFSGTLQYTGAGVNTDRLFSLQNSFTIDASGTGALNFTNTGTMGFNAGASAKTLTLTGNNTGSNTLATLIGDNTAATSITKNGTGTWVLSGNNTYTGATTINAGALNIQHANALGSIAGNTTVASGAALQLQGNISVGAELLTLSGNGVSSSGALRNIAGTNSYAGNIALGAAARINSDSGLLTLSGNLSGAQNLALGGEGNITISGIIGTSTGSLVKDGNGTLTLSANNTFSGTTTINSGILTLSGNGAFGTSTITLTGGTLDLGGKSLTNALSSLANGTISNGTLTNNGSNFLLQSGTISATLAGTNSLTKSGLGALTLNGSNTYSGGTTLSAGTININNASAIGNGTLSIAGGTLDSTVSGITLSTNNTQNWNGDFAFTGTNDLNLGTGSVTMNATRTVTVNGGNLTVGGAIAGAGIGLTKNGVGNLILSGANTYNGTTTIAAGNLTLGASNRLADTGAVTISGGTLNLGTFDDTVGSLTLTSGSLAGTGTLTAGTYALQGGSIGANLGTGTINATAGTTALNGTVAATTITLNGGNITLGSAGRLASGANLTLTTGTLTLGGSETVNQLTLNGGTLAGSGTFTAAADYAVQSGNITASLGGSAGLTKTGAGSVALSGANTYSGATTMSAGTLSISTTAAIANTSGITLGNTAVFDYIGSAATLDRSFSVTGGTGTIQNSGSGLLTLSGGLSKNGTTLTLKGGSGGISVSSAISGSAANSDLILDGGSITLASANSYNGPTYLINGTTVTASVANALPTANGRTAITMDATGSGSSTLALGASQSIASLAGAASSNVTLGSTTLTVGTTSGSSNFAGRLSGSGNLVKDGASTQVLSGSNSGFTGSTTVNSGTLTANSANALGSTTQIDLNGGSLLVAVANAVNDNADINLNGGTLAVSGTFNENVGALTLSANSTIDFSGFTGILRFGSIAFWASGAKLSVWNWAGTTQYGDLINPGRVTNLVFANNTNISNNLANISFYSDSGSSFIGNGFDQSFNSSGFTGTEIIAVPEPETYLVAFALLGIWGVYFLRKKTFARE